VAKPDDRLLPSSSRSGRRSACDGPKRRPGPDEIELWLADGAFRSHRLENAISMLASEVDEDDEDDEDDEA
jgi:hypothetical protein